MSKTDRDPKPARLSRREFHALSATGFLLAAAGPLRPASAIAKPGPMRSINIMNFIRAEEPREAVDLMAPVTGQMALIKQYQLPATWLLQYDAMVEGPYAGFLKSQMPADHETGIWFEMNRKLCEDAGIAWRGNPHWEWDYHVPVAYSIGYKPDERRLLVDTAMKTHKRTFGRDAKSVASWNLDAVTTAHLADAYGVDALGNCRDQLATDGFTIWGAPIAAYYPNRNNAWSPALSPRNQISSPMFRLLGQDPVYYYDKTLSYPDTMEPAWPSGQSEVFVDHFLDMIAHSPTQSVAYAQLGQENSFGWPSMQKAYAMQMERLAKLRSSHAVTVETMGETGRRFKKLFKTTPTQAQVMLEDPFGKQGAPERTIWYQSRFYRANMHFRGNEFYLRDLHVYSDAFTQPFLADTVETHGIEQRLLAVLDGYHWSDDAVRAGRSGKRAMGRFISFAADGKQTTLSLAADPVVHESEDAIEARVPLASGGRLVIVFGERGIRCSLENTAGLEQRLALLFEWVGDRSAFVALSQSELKYRFRNFDYSIQLKHGFASQSPTGVQLTADAQGLLGLTLLQSGGH